MLNYNLVLLWNAFLSIMHEWSFNVFEKVVFILWKFGDVHCTDVSLILYRLLTCKDLHIIFNGLDIDSVWLQTSRRCTQGPVGNRTPSHYKFDLHTRHSLQTPVMKHCDLRLKSSHILFVNEKRWILMDNSTDIMWWLLHDEMFIVHRCWWFIWWI